MNRYKYKIQPEQYDQIVSEYSKGKSSRRLGKIYNVSQPTILAVLKRAGYEKRHIKKSHRLLDESFFSKIDTEEKAYFLGLLCADGNVSKTTNAISISLQERDKSLLLHLCKSLKTDYKLTYVKSKNFISSVTQKMIHGKPQYRLIINNPRMKNDLMNLGCLPAKSLIIKFPTPEQVPDDLLRHFVRGFFDGDGSIKKCARKNRISLAYGISILSTEHFIKGLAHFAKLNLSVHMTIYPKHANSYEAESGGNQQVKRFLDWLYKDSIVYLERKYQLYLELVEQCDTNKILYPHLYSAN